MAHARYMTPQRFKAIKDLLAKEGASVEGVAKKTKSSWDTVKRVRVAPTYADYRPGTKAAPNTSTVVERLRAEKAKAIEEFDSAIRLAQHLGL